jgi:hypothetical protein
MMFKKKSRTFIIMDLLETTYYLFKFLLKSIVKIFE